MNNLTSRWQGWTRRLSYHVMAALTVTLIAACSTTSDSTHQGSAKPGIHSGRYTIAQDGLPDDLRPLDPKLLVDAIPQPEQRTQAGNKTPYTVLGKTYHVMPEHKIASYSAEGKASWYGKKFHGHKTSNGETYDMYKMSAAHRNLPIPSYVKVTNLDNGKTVVVRVNDRGPFHHSRLLDVSYAAAVKLDMVRSGTARVKVEAIEPQTTRLASAPKQPVSPIPDPQYASASPHLQPAAAPAPNASTYLQVGAFRSQDSAMALRSQLANLTGRPVNVDNLQGLFKVRIGPLPNQQDVQSLSQMLVQNNFAKPQVVYF